METFNRNRDWGVVQELAVEADTVQALRGAIMVASVDNKEVKYFRIETITKEVADNAWPKGSKNHLIGANQLTLLWSRDRPTDNELLFELSTVDEITDFVVQWLEKKAEWPTEEPDTDGSVERGFRVENSWDPFATVVKVTPTWIIYGK